jgi:hypothetical protein
MEEGEGEEKRGRVFKRKKYGRGRIKERETSPKKKTMGERDGE